MRSRRWAAAVPVVVALAGLVMGAAPAVRAAPAPAPTTTYTSRLLHFAVRVGPGRTEACDIVGELFEPSGARPGRRVPAILTTSGFGGSYRDQLGLARLFASRRYAVLAYSGLGFGGSGCKISLDDPDYDGAAASQLVSFLGGAPGVAFTDPAHTRAAPPVDFVMHDRIDHAGQRDRYDPRVGMVGGSYGGEVQFAAASVDPRIDTIVPLITWNDLAYSLAPNDAGATPDGSVTSTVPGSAKWMWDLLFSGEGFVDGLQGARSDPARNRGCPNFANWVCPGLAHAEALGYTTPGTTADLGHASVSSYTSRVRVPTLLIQGENDTLFDLNEAVATYRALQAQGTPVSMIWQSWGHSGSTPAPGELDLAHPDPATQYELARVVTWFDRYLAGRRVSTGPGFAYFQDWISYSGPAAPAYATAPSYPVGAPLDLFLSSGHALVGSPVQVRPSVQRLVTPPFGLPTGTGPLDAAPGLLAASGLPDPLVPDVDAPGTSASWATPPLTRPVTVVGEPVLHVKLSAPTARLTGPAGPAGDVVVFAKLYDVAPDGTRSLIHGLVAPARVADARRPLEITLPAVVHRFAAGDRIEIVLSGGDVNYRGGLFPAPVSVSTGGTGQVLELPTV